MLHIRKIVKNLISVFVVIVFFGTLFLSKQETLGSQSSPVQESEETIKPVEDEKDYLILENDYSNLIYGTLREPYTKFLDSIGKYDYCDVNVCWSRCREDNENLIIGASGAVWCGHTMGDEIDILSYDVLGFGGVTDRYINDWIPRIHKKYKKVVIYAGTNTVNLAANNGLTILSPYALTEVVNLIFNVQRNLLTEGGRVVYVNIKPMVRGQDSYDEKFIERYNGIAGQLKLYLNAFMLPTYDIPYPTTPEYSAGYIHYNNKEVYRDLLINS